MSGDRLATVGRRLTGDEPSDRRGFATSGSFLIVFVGLVIALGSLYTVTANSAERVGDAREDQRERHHAVQDTQVTITGATWDANETTLTVTAENTGDRTLSVTESDTLVDGTYVAIAEYERVEVDDAESGIWNPGETLVLADEDTVGDAAPGRVKLVTDTGVADAAEVVDA